jgi:hypothetical protein
MRFSLAISTALYYSRDMKTPYQEAREELRAIGVALTFDSDMSQFRITRWNEVRGALYFDDLADAIRGGQRLAGRENESERIRVSASW